MGSPKTQVKVERNQAGKSLAAAAYANSQNAGDTPETAIAKAKAMYMQLGTAEDFTSKKDAIVRLATALYNGDPTEIRISTDEVDTIVASANCNAASIEKDRLSIKKASSNGKTIVMSQPTELPAKDCHIVYKTQITTGTATEVSNAIASSMSRRLRQLAGGERDVSSAPSQEEVAFGEKSSQQYVEPVAVEMDLEEKSKEEEDTEKNSDIDSDEGMEGKLSSSVAMHPTVWMACAAVGSVVWLLH